MTVATSRVARGVARAGGLRPRPLRALSTTLRQRGVLAEADHRPWPLPERPWFMAQTWRRLLFAHWPVDPDALAPLVPPQLPLDIYDGQAWIGVTPFRVEGFRLRNTPPAPLISRFIEVNVRTYVELGGKPGIYFLSLDASSRFAVAGARRTYRLPYFLARAFLRQEGSVSRLSSRRVASDGPPAELECAYSPTGEPFEAKAASLEHWLTERYCLYTLAEGGTVQRGEIHHPPWPLQTASAMIESNTMASPYGLALAGEPALHYAERQDVVLWANGPIG